MKHEFEVIVGNVGVVYKGSDRYEGHMCFMHYFDYSVHNVGRAAGESVTFMRDGDTIAEWLGDVDTREMMGELAW